VSVEASSSSFLLLLSSQRFITNSPFRLVEYDARRAARAIFKGINDTH
jgi:hypothetical protein